MFFAPSILSICRVRSKHSDGKRIESLLEYALQIPSRSMMFLVVWERIPPVYQVLLVPFHSCS